MVYELSLPLFLLPRADHLPRNPQSRRLPHSPPRRRLPPLHLPEPPGRAAIVAWSRRQPRRPLPSLPLPESPPGRASTAAGSRHQQPRGSPPSIRSGQRSSRRRRRLPPPHSPEPPPPPQPEAAPPGALAARRLSAPEATPPRPSRRLTGSSQRVVSPRRRHHPGRTAGRQSSTTGPVRPDIRDRCRLAIWKQGIDACCRNFFFLLEEMILDPDSHGLAAALYLNLSCLEEAKPILGSSETVPFLTKLFSIGEPPISEPLVYQRISTPISC
ncbi:hypothetical protein Droror1_Dr00021161 [Drosera rotundifolia]